MSSMEDLKKLQEQLLYAQRMCRPDEYLSNQINFLYQIAEFILTPLRKEQMEVRHECARMLREYLNSKKSSKVKIKKTEKTHEQKRTRANTAKAKH